MSFPCLSMRLLDVPVQEPGGQNQNGMLFACWAIVIVLLAVSLVFLRAGKKNYTLAILPLVLVPFVHIFSGILSKVLAETIIPMTLLNLRVIIDVTAGLLSCLLLGLASRSIQGKRTRLAFFWCCAGFVIILTLVLVNNTMMLQLP